MRAMSSVTPIGEGLSFFKPSRALRTMPFFGPSLEAKSNSTTGTFTLTRCAAICAPITPAPSTATLRTLNLLITSPESAAKSKWRPPVSFDALPHLRAVQRPEVAAHLQRLAAVDRLQARAIGLAVVGVEHLAAAPGVLVVG